MAHIGLYLEDYYRGYEGGYQEFRLWGTYSNTWRVRDLQWSV